MRLAKISIAFFFLLVLALSTFAAGSSSQCNLYGGFEVCGYYYCCTSTSSTTKSDNICVFYYGVGTCKGSGIDVDCDIQAPTTSVSGGCPSACQASSVTITLSPSDPYYSAGIDWTNYCTGSGCTPAVGTTRTSTTISTEGITYFRYRSQDYAGNLQGTQQCTIQIDSQAPTTSVSGGCPSSPRSSSASITLTPSDPSPSCGIEWTKYCTTSGCDPSSGTTYSSQVAISSPGTTYFRYRSRDNAGNLQSIGSCTICIDSQAPTTSVSGSCPLGEQKVPVDITLTPSDPSPSCGIAWTRYCTGSGCDPSTTGTSTTISTPGYVYFRYRSQDNAGNLQSIQECILDMDSTPPVITSHSPETGEDALPTFIINTDENAWCKISLSDQDYDLMTKTCSNGGTRSLSCTPGTSMELGMTTYYIACTNPLNIKHTAANNYHYTYTRTSGDYSAPVLTNGQPTGDTNDNTPTLGVTATDSTPPIECRYSTSSSATYDQMTNTMSGGSGSPAQFSSTLSTLTDGSKTYYVKCEDSVNPSNKNIGTNDLPITFCIDTVNPTTSVSGGCPSSPRSSSASITLTPSDPSPSCGIAWTNYCTGSGCTPAVGTTRTSTTISTEDITYFRYRSQDDAGNLQSVQQCEICIDSQSPTTTDDAPSTSTSPVSVTLSRSDSGCSGLDYTQYCTDTSDSCTPSTTYSSPISLSTQGTYYVRYRSRDNAGNLESTKSSGSIRLDWTSPVISSCTPSSGSSGTPTFTCSVNENAWCRMSLSDESYDGMSDNWDCSGDGTQSILCTVGASQSLGTTVTYYIACRDSLSNSNSASNNHHHSYYRSNSDVSPPSRSNGQPSGYISSGSPTLSVTTSDSSPPVTCKYATTSGISYNSMPYTFSTTGGTIHTQPLSSLSDGLKNYYVRCQDSAQPTPNQNTNDYTISFTVDTTPPTTSDNAPSGWQTAPVEITLTPSDSGSGVAWTRYCTTSSSCTPGTSYSSPVTVSTQGMSYFRYHSEDNLGNQQSIVTKIIHIDSLPPSLSNCGPDEGTSGTPTFNCDADEDAWCRMSLADESYAAMSDNWDCLGDGTQLVSCSRTGTPQSELTTVTYYIACIDNINNADTSQSNEEHSYYRSLTVLTPLDIISKFPSGTVTSSPVTLSVTTEESTPGPVVTCRYSTTTSNYDDMTNFQTTGGTTAQFTHLQQLSLPDSSYIFYIECRDTLLNEASDTISFTLNAFPPVRSNGQPTGTITQSSATLSLTTNENARCRYSTITNIPYLIMGSATSALGTSHSWSLSGLTDGLKNYYVKCNDTVGNINTNDYNISFTVNTAETCNNNNDDDSDTLIDCADPECLGQLSSTNEVCCFNDVDCDVTETCVQLDPPQQAQKVCESAITQAGSESCCLNYEECYNALQDELAVQCLRSIAEGVPLGACPPPGASCLKQADWNTACNLKNCPCAPYATVSPDKCLSTDDLCQDVCKGLCDRLGRTTS